MIIVENIEDLQRLVTRIAEYGQDYGLTMNVKKTNFIRISKLKQTARI